MRGLSFCRNSIADQNPSHPWERGHLARISGHDGRAPMCFEVDNVLQFELTSLHAIFCGNILTFVSDTSEIQERTTCGLKT